MTLKQHSVTTRVRLLLHVFQGTQDRTIHVFPPPYDFFNNILFSPDIYTSLITHKVCVSQLFGLLVILPINRNNYINKISKIVGLSRSVRTVEAVSVGRTVRTLANLHRPCVWLPPTHRCLPRPPRTANTRGWNPFMLRISFCSLYAGEEAPGLMRLLSRRWLGTEGSMTPGRARSPIISRFSFYKVTLLIFAGTPLHQESPEESEN